MEIDIDDKFIEESRQIAMRMSKAILSIESFCKRHDESLGVLHQMILDLYKQTGKTIPDSIKNYKFKTADPWGCEHDN